MNKKILELRLQRLSYRKIAEQLNIGKTSVRKRIKEIYQVSDAKTKKKLDTVNQMNKIITNNPVSDEQILELRFAGMTTNEIAKQLNCSRSNIEKKLEKILDNASVDTREKLLQIKGNISKKERISITNITSYQLGIVWAIGNYNGTELFFRTRHRYFLEQIQDLTDSGIMTHIAKGKLQYKLKTVMFNIDDLKNLGWTERNAETRSMPILNNHSEYKDFIRAYMELHSTLIYFKVKSKDKKKAYKKLRLRIYGNESLIISIGRLLFEIAGVPIKSLYISPNGKTATTTYASLEEIKQIFKGVEGRPCYPEFWDDIYEKLENPIISL